MAKKRDSTKKLDTSISGRHAPSKAAEGKEKNDGRLTPQLRFPKFRNAPGWEVSSLGAVCQMQAGKFVSALNIKDLSSESLFPCYGGNGLGGYNRASVALSFTVRKANFGVGGCRKFVVRPYPLPFFPLGMGGRKYKPFTFDRRKPCLGCLKGW